VLSEVFNGTEYSGGIPDSGNNPVPFPMYDIALFERFPVRKAGIQRNIGNPPKSVSISRPNLVPVPPEITT